MPADIDLILDAIVVKLQSAEGIVFLQKDLDRAILRQFAIHVVIGGYTVKDLIDESIKPTES